MYIKKGVLIALSLYFFAMSSVVANEAPTVSLLLSHPVAPVLDGLPLTYFGVSTYSVQGKTLILAADEQACVRFLEARRRMDYLLNTEHGGTSCKKVNLIEIRRFFLPDLLPDSAPR